MIAAPKLSVVCPGQFDPIYLNAPVPCFGAEERSPHLPSHPFERDMNQICVL